MYPVAPDLFRRPLITDPQGEGIDCRPLRVSHDSDSPPLVTSGRESLSGFARFIAVHFLRTGNTHHSEEGVSNLQPDSMPFVRSQAAAMMGHMARYAHVVPLVAPALFEMLGDQSETVRRQALAELTSIGKQHPDWRQQIVAGIAFLRTDPDAVVWAQAAYPELKRH